MLNVGDIEIFYRVFEEFEGFVVCYLYSVVVMYFEVLILGDMLFKLNCYGVYLKVVKEMSCYCMLIMMEWFCVFGDCIVVNCYGLICIVVLFGVFLFGLFYFECGCRIVE